MGSHYTPPMLSGAKHVRSESSRREIASARTARAHHCDKVALIGHVLYRSVEFRCRKPFGEEVSGIICVGNVADSHLASLDTLEKGIVSAEEVARARSREIVSQPRPISAA